MVVCASKFGAMSPSLIVRLARNEQVDGDLNLRSGWLSLADGRAPIWIAPVPLFRAENRSESAHVHVARGVDCGPSARAERRRTGAVRRDPGFGAAPSSP